MDDKKEPTQQTRPASGQPVEIPVPKRSAWDRLLRKAAPAKLASHDEENPNEDEFWNK